jgi:hypothetical protein
VPKGCPPDRIEWLPSQDVVDERLLPDAAPAGFLAELIEHCGVNPNRNELARCVAKRRRPTRRRAFSFGIARSS